MNLAKIHLSPKELELVQNREWLLTKNEIIQKVYVLFGEIAGWVQARLNEKKFQLPPETLQLSPKISKGNQYGGLPYVMLDFPRFFGKEDILAIRCFFWWGNFFSLTLHLKGQYKELYAPSILEQLAMLETGGFFFDNGPDEWNQQNPVDNLLPVEAKNKHHYERLLEEKEFCKLSARVPLQQWNEADKRLLRLYEIVLVLLRDQFPSR